MINSSKASRSCRETQACGEQTQATYKIARCPDVDSFRIIEKNKYKKRKKEVEKIKNIKIYILKTN